MAPKDDGEVIVKKKIDLNQFLADIDILSTPRAFPLHGRWAAPHQTFG